MVTNYPIKFNFVSNKAVDYSKGQRDPDQGLFNHFKPLPKVAFDLIRLEALNLTLL